MSPSPLILHFDHGPVTTSNVPPKWVKPPLFCCFGTPQIYTAVGITVPLTKINRMQENLVLLYHIRVILNIKNTRIFPVLFHYIQRFKLTSILNMYKMKIILNVLNSV